MASLGARKNSTDQQCSQIDVIVCYRGIFFSRFLRIGNSCEYYFRLSIFISFSLYFTFALYIFCFLLVEEPNH